MRHTSHSKVWISLGLLPLVLLLALACTSETVKEVPVEVVVEKEVIREVQIPGETVVVEKEVVREVQIPGETVVVEKEVVREVQVPGETVVVEKEVVKEVMVPGETVVVTEVVVKEVEVEVVVVKEVVKEVMVPGETVVVEKEVVKEVMVPGETVVVEKEVVREVEVEVVVEKEVVKEVEVEKVVVVEKVVPAPAKRKVLKVMTAQNFGNFSPFVVIGHTQDQIHTFLFSGLLQADPFKLDWSPGLAERWEFAPDGSSYTFHIRKNALWHDGQPVTAKDVAFTFKTHLQPDVASLRAQNFAQIKGGQDFLDGKTNEVPGLVVMDDQTIRIELGEPDPRFVSSIWRQVILPEHILGDVPPGELGTHEYFLNPVGSGPFKFVKYIPSQLTELEANQDYYFGRPKLDGIQVINFDSMDALQIAMQRGEIHWQMSNNFSSDAYEAFINDPRLNVVSTPSGTWWHYLFSYRSLDAQGQDPRLHQAWLMAIDRETHVREFEPGSTVINTPIAMWDWFQKPEYAEAYPFDPAKSRELLEQMGWDPNREIEVITVAVEFLRDWMAVHQQWLGDVGIKIKPVFLDGPAFDDRYFGGDFDVAFIASGAGLDPDDWLSRDFTTKSQWASEPVVDLSGWADDEFLALIEAGRTTDRSKRIEVYQEISERLLHDLPYVPLHIRNNRWVVSKEFHWPVFAGLPEPTSIHDLPLPASACLGCEFSNWHVEEWDLRE